MKRVPDTKGIIYFAAPERGARHQSASQVFEFPICGNIRHEYDKRSRPTGRLLLVNLH